MQYSKTTKPLTKLSISRLRAALCIAVMNHKGGCGKTSLVDAMAHILVRMGYRVLIIDTDPQCNLTAHFGIFNRNDRNIKTVSDLYNTMIGENYLAGLEEFPINIQYPDNKMRENRFDTGDLGVLGLIAGSPSCELYAGMLKKMHTSESAVERFQKVINHYKQYYDFVFIDTAPSIQDNTNNEITVNIADKMIIPFDGTDAVQGMGLFMEWLKYADSKCKQTPLFVLSKYQADTKDIRKAVTGSAEETNVGEARNSVYRAMREELGANVCTCGIQELRVIKSHTFIGLSKVQQKPYIRLTKEIMHKLRLPRNCTANYWMDNRIQDKITTRLETLIASRQGNVPITVSKYYFSNITMEEER